MERNELFDLLLQFLEEKGWNYRLPDPIGEYPSVIAQFHIADQEGVLLIQVMESIFVFTSLSRLKVPKRKLLQVLKFVNLLNSKSLFGAYHLNLESNAFEVISSFEARDVLEGIVGKEWLFPMIEEIVTYNITVHGNFYPHIISVIEGLSAEEAFNRSMEDLQILIGLREST